MDDKERAIRQRLKDDFVHFAAKCLKIRTKTGVIKPLQLNSAQLHLHELAERQRSETGKVRVIVLKGRQMGISTYIEARLYWRVIHNFGVRAFVLAHEEEATKNLYEMSLRYHEHCPELLKPHTAASNAKELLFDKLDSGYRLGTAGNKATGRSATIQFLHASETAFWPNAAEHATGILQAVPNADGTEIFLESTASGIGSYFHQQWQLAESGRSDFVPVFIPWFWQTEYQRALDEEMALTDEELDLMQAYKLSKEQLNWRRYKILELSSSGIDGSKAFAQEYPCNATEAFQSADSHSFIDSALVMRSRQVKNLERIGALIIGVDPARFGADRTSIISRQGRVAFDLQTYSKYDTMQIAGIVHQLIQERSPAKVCIDVGGLGAGVVDRLKELGHGHLIVAVNAGERPINAERYINKRAEMWGELKAWLQDAPVEIPDNDELHADLCGIQYSFDSKTRLVMEQKEALKRRGLRSPDCAEALIQTFAMPMTALYTDNTTHDRLADEIMSKERRVNALRRASNAKSAGQSYF